MKCDLQPARITRSSLRTESDYQYFLSSPFLVIYRLGLHIALLLRGITLDRFGPFWTVLDRGIFDLASIRIFLLNFEGNLNVVHAEHDATVRS